MCVSAAVRAMKECGVRTQFSFSSPEECAQMLAQVCPHSRAALIFDEEGCAESYRVALAPFRPVCFLLQERAFTPLFSLDDDFRIAVGIGENSMAAARFFATLRGGVSLLVPLRPSAKGAFEPFAPPPFSGYPLADADFFAPSPALAEEAETTAEAALSALCAAELRLDSLFSGKEHKTDLFDEAADLAAEGGAEKTLCASVLSALALRGAASPFACTEAFSALRRQDKRFPAFPLFSVFVRRYAAVAQIQPRPFFVPDYAGRVRLAAQETGIPEKVLFSRLHIPRGEQSFAFSQIFLQSRARLAREGELLRAYEKKLSSLYFGAGGGVHRSSRSRAEKLYSCAAELSPLITPPALERELGICGAEHMSSAAIGT